jgi:hypothetical protein
LIKIFEKDKFGEKSTALILEKCIEKKEMLKNEVMKYRRHERQKSEGKSLFGASHSTMRSGSLTQSMYSKSRLSKSHTSLLGSIMGVAVDVENLNQLDLSKLVLKPSILEQ